MDINHIFDNNGKDNVYYANELSESRHDVAGRDGSWLLELNNQIMEKRVERRMHKRFQVNQDAFALIRPAVAMPLTVSNRSMAEIACAVYRSKPARFGRINNISMGGLSFRYITGEERSLQSLVLDILVADSGFYLENLTFKNISDFGMDDGFAINSFKMRLNRVQFEGPLPAQITKLRDFIHNYSITGMQR